MKNKGLTISAAEFIEEHNISESEFKDRIEKLQIPLLCRCPRTVAVHVSGSAIVLNDNEPRTAKSLSKQHKGTPFCADHDYHSKVDLDIKFLSISATDWEEIVNYDETQKFNFNHAFFHESVKGLTQASAHEQLKKNLQPFPALIIDADFFITTKTEINQMKEITIRKTDILIRTEDSNRILETIADTDKEQKNIERQEWESDNLVELNKASDEFIPEANIASQEERKELIDKIKKHLEKKYNSVGKDVFEQSAFAILPDKHYHKIKSTKMPIGEALTKYPEHASTALILINEAAKHFWQESQKTIQKAPTKRTVMIEALKSSDWGFTAKLAAAAATIISLKSRN